MHLKRSVSMEKEQMSSPDPVTALKTPPTTPVKVSTKACHTPNFCTLSNVLRLYCLHKSML
jgi:hypothetical protein